MHKLILHQSQSNIVHMCKAEMALLLTKEIYSPIPDLIPDDIAAHKDRLLFCDLSLHNYGSKPEQS